MSLSAVFFKGLLATLARAVPLLGSRAMPEPRLRRRETRDMARTVEPERTLISAIPRLERVSNTGLMMTPPPIPFMRRRQRQGPR
jgi:hypothetical protein